ncbi:MAG: cystathionine beta-lyase [Alphaproteobacteria bacterium]|nr:cystathionine beta-lyase [Alphaproteobacteria bacterium]
MKRKRSDLKEATLLAHVGRDPAANFGIINPPVYHASTVLFPSVAAIEESNKDPYSGVRYGRYGTPTTFALEEAVAALDGGARGVQVSSGQAAITVGLLAFLKGGDHLLMTDTAYQPTRRFCDHFLARFGVETTYYDPTIGAGIAKLIRPNTKVVYLESPSSLTFEVQDVPAIAAVARKHGAKVLLDNTWSSGLYFKPFQHGADVAIYAATKYIVGHSDAMLGMITMGSVDDFKAIKSSASILGNSAGPDDCYLGLRGLRTIGVRMRQHQENGLTLARWLQGRPEVAAVRHPALPNDAGHTIWKRDFSGASGLFGIVLKPYAKASVDVFLDSLELFGMGFSWGGFESLIIPFTLGGQRTATSDKEPGPMLRIHAGLEDPDDLIKDLEHGFAKLKG